jgi:hypothetical protein
MLVMSEKTKQPGERSGKRIDVSREAECRYWGGALGITPERLKEIVRQVGPMVSDVERLLRSQAKESRPA